MLVIDNSESERELDALRELSSELRFELFESPVNVGFGAGINRVFSLGKILKDEIIHIVNPDLELHSNSIRQLESVIEKGIADIVAPTVYRFGTRKKQIWHQGGRISRYTGRAIMLRPTSIKKQEMSSIAECSFLPGAFLSMRAETFLELGGFHEGFFLYWEDVEFSSRATRLGFRLACVRGAGASHWVGGSQTTPGKKSPTFFFYMHRNRLWLFGGWWKRLNLLLGLGMPYTLGLLAFSLTKGTPRIAAFAQSLRGIALGLLGPNANDQALPPVPES